MGREDSTLVAKLQLGNAAVPEAPASRPSAPTRPEPHPPPARVPKLELGHEGKLELGNEGKPCFRDGMVGRVGPMNSRILLAALASGVSLFLGACESLEPKRLSDRPWTIHEPWENEAGLGNFPQSR